MHKEVKLFVMFRSPGAFVANSWTRDVESRDPYAVEWPANAYAFTLNEREDIIDGAERFVGKVKQIGPTYYHPDSKVETLEEVERNPNASATLVGNMRCNDWGAVVWSRWGNWPQPFDPTTASVL